jgi:alcohol dehydrogenase
MKAARLHEPGGALVITEVADLRPRPGSAIVRVQAAFVPPFMTKVRADSVRPGSGYRTPPFPFTPGIDAVGVVESVAAGVTAVQPGDRVYCNPFYGPRDAKTNGARAFIGSFALDAESVSILEQWRDGAFAERMILPAECVVPLPSTLDVSGGILCRLGWLGTAAAALRKAGMEQGSTVVVNGATGLLGSSAVALALALGAHRVFALGRSPTGLAAVAALDSARVVPTKAPDRIDAADVLISCVDGGDASLLARLLACMRVGGHCVVIGATSEPLPVSLGWLLANDITLRGSLWFERQDADRVLELAVSRDFDFSIFAAETFALAQVEEALAAACRRASPLTHVALDCR